MTIVIENIKEYFIFSFYKFYGADAFWFHLATVIFYIPYWLCYDCLTTYHQRLKVVAWVFFVIAYIIMALITWPIVVPLVIWLAIIGLVITTFSRCCCDNSGNQLSAPYGDPLDEAEIQSSEWCCSVSSAVQSNAIASTVEQPDYNIQMDYA